MTDPNSPIIDFYPIDFEVDMNGKRFLWQGIAKLPFIDEGRLLEELVKIEHTLTEEEARRNSKMSVMLFVSLYRTLSPYIFSLDDRCKHMTDKDRVLVKERLDPGASGGMNGYISLCAGDPCPPVFRSPISGMEDIMNNQVICSIYRLPEVHKHFTKPPPGVIFPKKIVTVGDLKPDPVLWHEDTGRRPFDNNGRRPFDNGSRHNNNTNGTISGRQLGDAAHRLVTNSLQQRGDHNGHAGQTYPPYPPHAAGQRSHYQHYQNQTYQGGEHAVMQQHASSGYAHHRPPSSMPYRQPYVSQTQNPHNRFQNPRNEVQDRPVPHVREYNRHEYYPPVPPQHSGHGYPPYPSGSGAQASVRPDAYFHPQRGYNNLEADRSYGGHYNHKAGSWVPPVNPNAGRGYNHPRQSGNQFSALGRGGGRRPPHSDYRR